MMKLIALENGKKLIKDMPVSRINGFLKKRKNILWINVERPSEIEFKILSKVFGFHPLEIEDCRKKQELPKIDEFEDHAFIVFHRISYDFKKHTLDMQELDIFLGKNYIITIPNEPIETVSRLHERCASEPRTLFKGVDFILHNIINEMVDEYMPILDHWDDEMENMESEILTGQIKKSLQRMLKLKRHIRNFRKSISPQRDIINRLAHPDFTFVSAKAHIYFRDVYDHMMRAYSIMEDQRDTMTTIFEAYLSTVSNKLNEIMKTLTIIATIFMPLTFIVGLYGMNFHYMPELEWRYGYYMVWSVLIFITMVMIVYFKKKGWV
jgi:magnesium transporter